MEIAPIVNITINLLDIVKFSIFPSCPGVCKSKIKQAVPKCIPLFTGVHLNNKFR